MAKNHYIIPVFVPHAGCPHQCVFCNQRNISGQQRVPTAAEVESQIELYLESIGDHKGKVIEVAFFGGSFTAIPEHIQRQLIEPATGYWQRGRIDYLRLSTRPDCLRRDNLAWLFQSGVRVVELGVQSMDEEVLTLAKRGHTRQDVVRGIELVREAGFQLGLQMMTGLPGDSREKAMSTGLQLAGLAPDFVRIYPVLVVRGTELAELYAKGLYRPWDLPTTVEVCKELLKLFSARGIDVIRIGLQTSEKISLSGDILAGPYHPALRELVEAKWARERLEQLLLQAGIQPSQTSGSIIVEISPQDVSIVRGQRNSNISYFRKFWGIEELKLKLNPSLSRRTMLLVGEYTN